MAKGVTGFILAIVYYLILGFIKTAGFKNAVQGRK